MVGVSGAPLDNSAGLGGGWRGLAVMIKRTEPLLPPVVTLHWGPSPVRELGKNICEETEN